jgi:hypothetical protein
MATNQTNEATLRRQSTSAPRERALPGCCRGCDVSWKDNVDGRCSKCRCCGECCGRRSVPKSCGAKYECMPLATKIRHDRGVQAARDKRHREDFGSGK